MNKKKSLIIIGNGMVGHRLCEYIVDRGLNDVYDTTVFGEEPVPAYDRVRLSEFFKSRDVGPLMLGSREWYDSSGLCLVTGRRIVLVDRENKRVRDDLGEEHEYDYLVLATGSAPFVPPIPGVDKKGVFVYRTLEDLREIIEYSAHARSAAVIGGGLLGLEAAKAALDLGLDTHVVEFAPRLMPRQLDDAGAKVLRDKIQALNVSVHAPARTSAVTGNGSVTGLAFEDGAELQADMVIISAGIRPRDELAKAAGLEVGERGGVVVDSRLRTSDPSIFAVGEAALYNGMIYGLVAPGYEMAAVVVANLAGEEREFHGADMSTKLKLIGVDVASFGDALAEGVGTRELSFVNPARGIYKKLVVNAEGTRLVGGILVGDASDYGKLNQIRENDVALPGDLDALFFSGGAASSFEVEVPDGAQICKCNDVSKGDIVSAISEQGACDMDSIKKCTRAGAGCGGCVPQVGELLRAEMKKSGKELSNHVCEHFPMSRRDLFTIVKVKGLTTFNQVLAEAGAGGQGCETCKPAVASILASLWNELVSRPEHAVIQDTNDRFLANIQKGGSYSVVPRVPGGEITPEQLIRIGEVAKKYDLYCKITGGQRIDLFGARVDQLPFIWEELIEVGLESGHAYGKALRTVKSCVGSTWCRFGVQDSTTMAIRLEKRYRGLRAPHKLKSAVSGCIRECAEAQSKDFGVIATEKGWNLYVCGNGGASPRHADLLASDLDDETLIRLIDRFLMYYIRTADKLERTATWFKKLEGGLEHLRAVLIEDSLGICADLEQEMRRHVDTYRCEWTEVVNNPELRMQFRHFANSDAVDDNLEFERSRGQKIPAGSGI